MEQRHSFGKRQRPLSRWIRHNVIDAGPLWGQLLRDAVAHVKIN
jgi:hypothetical protein